MFSRNKYVEPSPELIARIKEEARKEQLLEHAVTTIELQRKELRETQTVVENLRLAVIELQTLAAQATAATPMWSNIPLHVTEDEEDAKWQLDNGMINQRAYEEILEDIGLEPNVTIHY